MKSMIRTAVIDLAAGVVVNVIEFEGALPDELPGGVLWHPCDTAQIGDSWDGQQVIPAVSLVPVESWADARERALECVRIERAPILSILDGLQATAGAKGLQAVIVADNATATTYVAQAQQIEALKQALKDAPTAVDLASCVTFEDMRQAFKAYYAAHAASAPDEIKALFNEVNA